ncbi:MAG: hypothetical protein H7329_02455 [Opitutaceae bacterium]|nr:hypothetical protein [Cytophagales bacterium]
MALLEMDQAIIEGIKRAGYSHVICTALSENESSAVEHELEESLLKLVPVRSIDNVEEQGGASIINMHDAETQLNKVYTNEMSVRFFIEGRYAC